MVSKKKLNISSSELNTIKPITDNQKEVLEKHRKIARAKGKYKQNQIRCSTMVGILYTGKQNPKM